ncbi:MAG: hypothetical protein CMJ39_09865 [Phycisphaerae bacterium]|nr:hypothetical protein [Phycisphaerae bacterium]
MTVQTRVLVPSGLNRIKSIIAMVMTTSISMAHGEPVQWTEAEGGNGHWYQVITTETGFPNHQPEAYFELAESRGGYAVSITSLEEDLFIYDLSIGTPGAWEPGPGFGPVLGGRSTGNCDFWWVNGDPWGYSSWGPADPGCNGEYVAYCICGQSSPNETERWWIDADPSYGGMKSGVIEWSADCNGDGIVDYGQILDGTYQDADGNGVPDCCDEGEPCDSVPPGSNHVLELNNWPDAAVIPHHPSVTPSDAMTIEFWIKVEGGNSNSRPITKRPGNGGCYTVSAYTTAEGCQAGVDVFGDCNGASWGDIGCEWVHLAQTVDGSTGVSRGYINGELVSILDQGGSCGIGQGSWDLRFGNTNGFSSTQFIGRLDNIRIWNSVLEEDEIRHWMGTDITSAIAATLPDLGGSWNFEDGVTDATGVNDGWLEGSAVLVEDEAIYLDCNGNAVADSQDITDGTSTDFNGNQIPDECECLADVDGDGQVAVNDVLLVIAQWGQPGPLADVDLDGTVGVNDVLMVLNGWGACP